MLNLLSNMCYVFYDQIYVFYDLIYCLFQNTDGNSDLPPSYESVVGTK